MEQSPAVSKSQMNSPARWERLMHEHLTALRIKNYSEYTIRNRQVHIGFFIAWLKLRDISAPCQITRQLLEDYQRHLFQYRKRNGDPLSFRSQHAYIIPLRMWFRWMTRENRIPHNPASELELPRLGRSLPKNILSAREIERVLRLCNLATMSGLRDRAIMEVLYSTGIRRMELIGLKLFDLCLDRGLILVREGKGKKDRYVPIGKRAIGWLERYLSECRLRDNVDPDNMTVFLTVQGQSFSRDHLSYTIRMRIEAAKLGKTGSCHLFRHSMATLMHEGGADIRYIQQMLGHEDIKSTQIYTHVALRGLQEVHAATHPAEATYYRASRPRKGAAAIRLIAPRGEAPGVERGPATTGEAGFTKLISPFHLAVFQQ
jgi:integrase/recombinase XerD